MEVKEPSAKYLAKPAYKQTELGLVPQDWQVKQIGDLQPFVTSGSRGWAAFYSEFGSPFIRITNLSLDCIYPDLDDLRFVNIPQSNSEGVRTQLSDGDVLISITADIGIVGYVTAQIPKPAYINQHIALVRLNSDRTSPHYVSYFIASERTQKLFRAATDSGAKAGMNLATVKQIKVALPPTVDEQQAIATALSDADALIESVEQLLVKKRQIKQGAAQELLTGKRRLPGFAGRWEEKRLDELGRWVGGMTPSMQNSVYWNHGVVPWISSGDVKSTLLFATGFSVSETAIKDRVTTLIPEKSIVVVMRSGILRNYFPVAMNMIPMAINQDIKAIIPACGVLPDYLLQVLIGSGDRILARCLKFGTTVESIEFRWLKSFVVSLPPISEQTAIAEVLSDIDDEIVMLEAKLTKARQIKQGMMQELLTGRIRLVQFNAKVIPLQVVTKPEKKATHNWQINEAVVISVLAKHFGSEQWPLGRKRYTKLSYLLHRHVEHQAEGYLKKAAGPYNPATKYGGPEKIALKNKYVRQHTRDNFSGFVVAEKISEAEGYFLEWYGADVLAWVKQFRMEKNDELELLATTDMAVEDLRRANKVVTLAGVKQVIQSHPEWQAKLEREIFSDANIERAMARCRELFGER